MPRRRANKGRFPYDPGALFGAAIGWGFALIPKIQAAVGAGAPETAGARIYGAVADHLFGTDDGEESHLWRFLMAAKPDGIDQPMHEAMADLTECGGRISADMVENIAERVRAGKEAGKSAAEIVEEIRNDINATMNYHDLEHDIQAVIDA